MYRFLDQPLTGLDEHFHFLVGAMRQWTVAARRGRCPCAALAPGFAWRGVASALPDFTAAMAAVDREGKRWLRFGAMGAPLVSEDEAAMLSLFAAAMDGDALATRRIGATLVTEGALPRLTTAIDWVALRFIQSPITQRD